MKKICLSAFAIASAQNSFAYYDGYSSGYDSPWWFSLTGIIMLIGGILEIILFFKIWGMTNDIRSLKNDHFKTTKFYGKYDMAVYLRKNILLGNMEGVKQTLLKNFIDNVERGFEELKNQKRAGVALGTEKYNKVDKEVLEESIAPYVESLIRQYNKIGEEVPAYIVGMKTFEDYFTLFTSEDLIVKVEKNQE